MHSVLSDSYAKSICYTISLWDSSKSRPVRTIRPAPAIPQIANTEKSR